MARVTGEEDDTDLPPSEAARARRRDHDATAAGRAGMRTGLAKQFKQVLDAQAKRADEARRVAAGSGGPDEAAASDEDDVTEAAPKKRGHHGGRHNPSG